MSQLVMVIDDALVVRAILDRIKGRLVGAHAYLTKPFRTQTILQTILEVVQMHLGRVNGREITKPLSPSRLAVPVLGQEEDQGAKRGTTP